ncbi:MAG: RNA methyltransferase [Saprospiraceae bacterium]
MISHAQVKHLRSLGIKKYRQQCNQFIVEGEKMVIELLGQNQIPPIAIFAIQPWIDGNSRMLKPFAKNIFSVTQAELEKISTLSTPNKVLALADIPIVNCDFDLAAKHLCFYLDGIQDPGNMGSILRIADWFGFPAVYCSPDCVDVFSPKVVQASMGAILRVRSWEIDLSELLEEMPHLSVAGAVLDGLNVFKSELPQQGLLVIGNEGRGLSPKTNSLLTHRISIPKHAEGRAESLNAAVAAGILAAVFRR